MCVAAFGSMWEVSSLTRGWNLYPLECKHQLFATGLPGKALSHNFWESGICRSSWVPWFWVPWSSRGSSRADPLPGAWGVSTAFTWSSCALARGFPCPLGPPQGSSQPGPSFHQSERARKGMYSGNQSCNLFSEMTS